MPRLESVSNIEFDEADGRHLVRAFSSIEEESNETGQSSEISQEEYSPSIYVSEEKKDEKPGVTLSEAEMSPGLRSELCEIRKVHSDEPATAKELPYKITPLTKCWKKIGISVVFEKYKKSHPPLIHYANLQLVQEFVQFMMDKRGVKPITCSQYISALINVSKVPLDSYGSSDKEEPSKLSEKIRAVQRQLEHLVRKEHVDALAQKPQLEKDVYSELLALCRELKWEVEEKSKSGQGRSCMNLCLL